VPKQAFQQAFVAHKPQFASHSLQTQQFFVVQQEKTAALLDPSLATSLYKMRPYTQIIH
jgi:hypothetical protein